MDIIMDIRLKNRVEELLELTAPLTQEYLDILKARPDYNTDGLVVGKSKCIFFMEYPPADVFKEAKDVHLVVETVWDHELEAFYNTYTLLGEPNSKIVRVTKGSNYFANEQE